MSWISTSTELRRIQAQSSDLGFESVVFMPDAPSMGILRHLSKPYTAMTQSVSDAKKCWCKLAQPLPPRLRQCIIQTFRKGTICKLHCYVAILPFAVSCHGRLLAAEQSSGHFNADKALESSSCLQRPCKHAHPHSQQVLSLPGLLSTDWGQGCLQRRSKILSSVEKLGLWW